MSLLLLLLVLQIQSRFCALFPSDCIGLKDGIYSLKLLEGDKYPVITVRCSNEYIILDYNLDNNIKYYFNSFEKWILDTAGPDNSNLVNWKDWFIPSSLINNKHLISWIVSPNCHSCDENNNFNKIYNNETTYWMTGTIFGCFWPIKGQHNCDLDYETQICYSCSRNFILNGGNDRIAITEDSVVDLYNKDALVLTGICPSQIKPATHVIMESHDNCQNSKANKEGVYKPSLGLSGKKCVCYKQIENKPKNYEGNKKEASQHSYKKEIAKDKNEKNLIELYSSDFKHGTYRITKPGTYKIMEDLKLSFNSPRNDAFDENNRNIQEYWMPLPSQADKYPGAGGYHDTYFLGFFAGISIECDNVVIDLNDKSIAMDEIFYYQQRWFTIIELSKQYFLSGQGIGNFGATTHFSKNIIIKDGILGLSSHHGIHGNYNENVYIKNVIVRDFETHGIQFNGFNNIKLLNVEVGPTTTLAKLTGEYSQWRYLLPRIKKIAHETTGESIKFYGRNKRVTMQEIADEIELKMNYAFNYVVFNIEYDTNDIEYNDFISAKELFVNENGIPYASAQYGIFLNTFGASVFTYNLYNSYYSNNAILKNIKIHDLQHKMVEYVRFFTKTTGNIYINPFNAPLDAKNMVADIENLDLDALRNGKVPYKGNILTDAYIAMNKLSDNWNYLQVQIVLNDELVSWALNNDASGIKRISVGCNSDVMLHSGKGTQALRLDGVKDVTIKNLEVYNIYDYTDLGSNICNNYTTLDSTKDDTGGHFRQILPMQSGFSGNMNQGININAAVNIVLDDIYIHNLVSDTGPVFGISIWPSCEVELKGDIIIHDLYAGSKLKSSLFTYNSRPNKSPEVCGIRIYNLYDIYTTTVTSNVNDIKNVISCGFNGDIGCLGNKNLDITQYIDTYNGNSIINDKFSSGIFKQTSYFTMAGNYIHINYKNKNCGDDLTIKNVVKNKFSYNIISHNTSDLSKKRSILVVSFVTFFGSVLFFMICIYCKQKCQYKSDTIANKYTLLDYGATNIY